MRIGFARMPDASPSKLALGEAVRYIREREELTQEELAFQAGVHPTWISDVETGKRDPRLSSVARLAVALGVTTMELIATAERTELD